MMPSVRFWELTAYAILRLLPFLLLMLYIFWGELRFPKWATVAGLVLLLLVRIGLGLYSYYDELRSTEPNPGFFVYVAASLLFVKAHYGKTLFSMIMLNNISSFTVVASKCLEGLVFSEEAAQLHRWTNSLSLLLVSAAVLIPLFFYIKLVYIKALRRENSPMVWRLLWLIPTTFYFVWYRNSFFGAEGFNVLALRPSYTVFSLLVTAGGMLVYSMVMQLINEHAENDRLRENEAMLRLQHAQYGSLQDRIEEARRAKHDLRGHIHVMSAYLKDKKYDELEQYLNKYRATLPEDVTISFCENYAVNALLQYFAGYAKIIGAGFSASVRLPENVGVPDEELTVVLGNLLENATEACVTQGKHAVLSVRAIADEGAVFFKIVNSCPMPPKTDRQGRYLSSKRKRGYGIGLDSVRRIAERYRGMMTAEWADGCFTVSVMLGRNEAEQ